MHAPLETGVVQIWNYRGRFKLKTPEQAATLKMPRRKLSLTILVGSA